MGLRLAEREVILLTLELEVEKRMKGVEACTVVVQSNNGSSMCCKDSSVISRQELHKRCFCSGYICRQEIPSKRAICRNTVIFKTFFCRTMLVAGMLYNTSWGERRLVLRHSVSVILVPRPISAISVTTAYLDYKHDIAEHRRTRKRQQNTRREEVGRWRRRDSR